MRKLGRAVNFGWPRINRVSNFESPVWHALDYGAKNCVLETVFSSFNFNLHIVVHLEVTVRRVRRFKIKHAHNRSAVT